MRAKILSSLTFLLFACGAENVVPPPTPNTEATTQAEVEPEAEETSPPEIETTYAIHEWGFIAQHYADGENELLTSATAPAPERSPPARLPSPEHELRGGKPVIYVHLQGEGNIARFTASLSTSGQFLEEWPHSENSTPTSLTWEVEARRGSCSASSRYPIAADRHCRGIADRYCEAAELANYETQDSACLTVGDQEWNHLFYRAQMTNSLPLRVSKRGDAFMVQNSGTLPGRLMRIHRATDAVETRITLFDAPAAGESLTLPAADQPATDGIAALEAELSALGMSEDEVGAFMTAWQPELFGDTAERRQVEMVGSPPRGLRPKDDALIYFLPAATLDVMVPFAFTPPPAEVRRAVLVRIDLGEAYVAPLRTLGLDRLGVIPSNGNGYGQGSGAAPQDRRRVRMGRVVVDGSLSSDVVRRVMRRHVNEIRFCGEQEPDPGSETRLDLQFVVGTTGAVQSASVENSATRLATCVAGAARRWVYPSPESGVARVSTSIRFEVPE